ETAFLKNTGSIPDTADIHGCRSFRPCKNNDSPAHDGPARLLKFIVPQVATPARALFITIRQSQRMPAVMHRPAASHPGTINDAAVLRLPAQQVPTCVSESSAPARPAWLNCVLLKRCNRRAQRCRRS